MTDRKSRLSLVSLLLCALLLCGCGTQADNREAAATAALPEPSAAPSATAEETEAPVHTEPTDTAPNVLVVWFSATGTTERIAMEIAGTLGADAYAIVPETPYTDADLNYGHSASRATVEQNDASARPAIAGTLPDMTPYDTVFLGYPIWFGQAPRILSTFLNSCDLSGKTVVPFCTSGSSGVGSSAESLRPLAAGANWMEGKRFDRNAPDQDITDWLSGLPLEQMACVTSFDLSSGKNGWAPTVTLNSGYAMPVLGLGTWTQDDATAENSVYQALQDGYRLIDTARYYGNEAGIGAAVRRAIDEGVVTREEVFITSKIVPSGSGTDYKAAIAGCNERLGLGYIDLMLIHQQGAGEEALYRAIEDAIDGGSVRSLGISNYYTAEDFDRITTGARVIPAVIQNENHPFYQNTELQGYVTRFGTLIESYYPFGGRGHTEELFNAEPIDAIAQAHGKTSAQILIRWHLQAGYIAIPGSSNPDHIAENFDVFGFALSQEEMERIAAMDTGERYESW